MAFMKSKLLVLAVVGLTGCTDFGGIPNSGASGNIAGEPGSPAHFTSAIGDRILFEVDQSSLTLTAQSLLNSQAGWLAEYPKYSALIEGHADEQGTREYNLALGARRASAVRDYLVGRGVADTRVATVTFGKERPLEVCSTEACWSQNRRAVTVVSAGAGT